MPVNTTHAQYDLMAPVVKKCRDCVGGQRPIHKAGETYLPRLSGQDKNEDRDADYLAFLKGALFFNATGRTLEGMTGLIFRKDPVILAPDAAQPLIDDVTMSGKSLAAFSDQIVDEVFTAGRVGFLVDYPANDPEELTQAEAESQAIRPLWGIYPTERIINWRTESVNNQAIVTRVVLSETVQTESLYDEFVMVDTEQIRVLDLLDGNYRQRLFVKGDAGYVEGEARFPVMNGKPMDRIPFYFVNKANADPDCVEPPLSALADVNLSHYQSTAYYEHGCRYGALPTPWGTGISDDETPDGIGPNTFWSSTSKDAKFGMLEFSGQGIQPIVDNIEGKEAKMAALGAEMLLPEKMAAETEGSKRMDKQTKHSVVSKIAAVTSAVITDALIFTAEWFGITGEIDFELNRDYAPGTIDAPLITAMLGAVQTGNMSFETFYGNLQRGELAASEVDAEDELDRIDARAPVITGLEDGDE